jgi:hypothetical protein
MIKSVVANFKEWLLQRSLWQITVVYLIFTWAALGHVDLLTDRFGMPNWVFDASLAAALAGLLGILLVAAAVKRHVPLFRFVWVGAVYLVAGWILLEAVGFMTDNGLIGNIVFRVVSIAAVALIPLVLLIALFLPGRPDPGRR